MPLSVSIDRVHGFHSTLTTRTFGERWRPNCSFHLLHHFPPHIFVDPYELASRQIPCTLLGSMDLELPETAVAQEGSGVLLNVSLPAPLSRGAFNLTIDIPVHVRYAKPRHSARPISVEIPLPVGFWSCPRSKPHSFPAQLSGLPSSFHSSSVFVVPPASSPNPNVIQIPVGDLGHLKIVEAVTFIVIYVSFAFLLLVLFKTSRKLRGVSKSE